MDMRDKMENPQKKSTDMGNNTIHKNTTENLCSKTDRQTVSLI